MAKFNLKGLVPVIPTGILVVPKGEGFSASWANAKANVLTEVRYSNVNNRDATTGVVSKTVNDSYYDSPKLTPGTYYVWTRNINAFGTPSEWDNGVNAGKPVIVSPLTVAATAIAQVASNVLSLGASSSADTTVSQTYGTWQNTNSYLEFTIPQGAGTIGGYVTVGIEGVSLLNLTIGNFNAIYSRGVFFNVTDNKLLPHTAEVHCHQMAGTKAVMKTYNPKSDYGFATSPLIPGKKYRYLIQTLKDKNGTDAFTVNMLFASLSTATASSVSY